MQYRHYLVMLTLVKAMCLYSKFQYKHNENNMKMLRNIVLVVVRCAWNEEDIKLL